MIQKYKATFIGLFFTVTCLLLYYTFIIPLLTILPLSLPLEIIFNGIYPGQSYAKTGRGVIISLTVVLIVLSFIFFTKFYRQIKETQSYKSLQIIFYFILLQFVIHPLVFYIDLSNDWSRASDGQFFLGAADTFQLSSLTFLIIGIAIDGLKMYRQMHSR